MLFGHFQKRSNQTIIVGIEDLLSTFETIRGRQGGSVSGFALNPLSSIEYVQVLTSLGYTSKIDPSFSFIMRIPYISGACTTEARNRMRPDNPDLEQLIGSLLPDEYGMERISSEPLH